MGDKSGLMFRIKGRKDKAIAYHSEQEEQFKALNKFFIHFLTDSFEPILVDGKPKKGLISEDKLTLIGFTD